MQNMLVNRIFNREEFTSNLGSVIELARRANVPISFTRIQMLPIRFESSARLYTLKNRQIITICIDCFEDIKKKDMSFLESQQELLLYQ
jgi:hypothetical protein